MRKPRPGQRLGGAEEAALGLLAADRQQDVLLRQGEPGREDGLEEGLVDVLAQAGDLAGRGHLDAQVRVGALEPGEGELRRLDADVVEVEGRSCRCGRAGPCMAADGQLDEVRPGHLGDERERARGPQVALDDLDGVVLGDELDVERAGDARGPGRSRGRCPGCGGWSRCRCFCGGRTMVASPEWTPAFSTCSTMAEATIRPRSATASSSISLAFRMNLLMTTGYSGETREAFWR